MKSHAIRSAEESSDRGINLELLFFPFHAFNRAFRSVAFLYPESFGFCVRLERHVDSLLSLVQIRIHWISLRSSLDHNSISYQDIKLRPFLPATATFYQTRSHSKRQSASLCLAQHLRKPIL